MLASRTQTERDGAEAAGRSAALAAFIERHGSQLLRTARRYSDSAADAEDVYQSAVEVLLSKAPDGFDDDRLLAWTLTVTRNEALMEHRRKEKVSRVAFDEIAERLVDPTVEADDQVLAYEELGQAREALERVTPDQLRCLLLRADGLGYPEICETTGFSYAKVNRCLSEGRKAFRDQVERIESGAECSRLSGVLSMMADGVASAEKVADAELHLKNCVACRATLRDYREIPDRAAIGLPLGVALASGGIGSRIGGLFDRMAETCQSAYASMQERIAGHAAAIGPGGDVLTAKKAAALVATVATVIGGGVALEKAVPSLHDDNAGARAERIAPAATAPLAGTQVDRLTTRRKAAARRRARAATAADVRRSTSGTTARVPTTDTSAGRSAGTGDEFDPQPPAEPVTTGRSDEETGLAP